MYEHGDIQRASIELIAKAESRGAVDNTSVVIVCLNQQDRTNVVGTPSRKGVLPRSYSLKSDTSSTSNRSNRSKKNGTWNMIKRHHSDCFAVGSLSNESLGSLSVLSSIFVRMIAYHTLFKACFVYRE